jgi:cyclopropane-fatty-acyl-phospholipid synthase
LAAVQNAQANAALRILMRLLHGYAGGADLRPWNDGSHSVGQGPPAFTLVLRDPMLRRSVVTTRGPVLLADAYFRCQIDVEGDFYSALALKGHFEGLALPWRDKLAMLMDAWRLPPRMDPAKSAGRAP